LIYLSHFDIYQYVIYVLNLITERRQYYHSFIYQDYFIVNHIFTINCLVLYLIFLFIQYNHIFIDHIHFIFDHSII